MDQQIKAKVPTNAEFLNKRVIITGASSGIGKACAYYFLNAGAKVVLCGRDIKALKKIGDKFPEQGAAIKVDLSGDLQLFDFKTSVVEILGGIDIMVNCAGVLFDGDIEKTFPQDYDFTVDVNLRSVFAMLLHFKQFLAKGASIINVSCLYGSRPQAGMASYCMSKAGLEMLTKFAAAEFAELDIRVNAVSASPVDTNCQRYVGVGEREYAAFKTKISNNIPLGRMARPDDVAKMIVFLASKRSGKVTGQILKSDGGRSLTSSGYVHWRGIKNMNSRFEPDGPNLTYKMAEIARKVGEKVGEVKPIQFPENEEEIDKLINEANWSTRLSEAHEKVTASYKSIEQNDIFLMSKFVNKDNKKY